VFWLSRRQAQNAADAGALAGAVAMAYDVGAVSTSAVATAGQNPIFGEAAVVDPNTDLTYPSCPDGTATCVRVDVVRSTARGNPLPVFFGGLVGRTGQTTRATATAQAASANAVECLKPFALPDRWVDSTPAVLPSTFGAGDFYAPPTSTDPGTGYGMADRGQPLVIKVATSTTMTMGTFFPVELSVAGCGSNNCYSEAIIGCTDSIRGIGDTLTLGAVGQTQATIDGVTVIINQDPGASWDSSTQSVVGGCAPACGGRAFSPRLVAVPVIDPRVTIGGNSGSLVPVTNIVGFFVDHITGDEIHGYLLPLPGVIDDERPEVSAASAFLKAILLVR
jgi:hypothetical protein